MTKLKILTLILLISFTATDRLLSQENIFNKIKSTEMNKMSFLLGEWKLTSTEKLRDGNIKLTEYRSSVELTAGRKALADYFMLVRRDGTLDTNGVTVRTYDERTKKWRMIFYSDDLNFYTIFEGHYKDGEFHFNGKGNEYGREYLEKVVFFNIKPDSYSWTMARSYDGGESWANNVFAYDAVRIK